MNCQQAREWLDGFIDGELDLAHSIEIERHLKDCSQCAATRDAALALRERLRSGALSSTAPVGLDHDLRTQLRRAQGSPPFWRVFVPILPYAAIAAMLAVAFALWRTQSTSHVELALSELTAAHVRSTQVDHLTDVVSSDQHTVKPWFEGKLDFSPPVRDFKENGFELVGGRLDYLNGRAVAAIVYRRKKHLINVFICPETGDDASPHAESSQGFNVVRWRKAGMSFDAISDLNQTELTQLAKLMSADGP